MRRKVYTSGYERKRDQRIGAVVFVVVNVIVWLVYRWLIAPTYIGNLQIIRQQTPLAIQLMPWVVNGVFLLWAFIFRPQIGVGYIAGLGLILLIVGALSTIFVGACFASVAFIAIGLTALGTLAFFGTLLVGSIWFIWFAWTTASRWWSNIEED